jgi:predicted acylesterase/phospholipase RssA
MPEETPEFDHDAVITIQGGGIYLLNLLGQLSAVVNDRSLRINPLALSGNSAGAIIATLFWAGLTPEQILDKILDLVPGGFRLVLLPAGAGADAIPAEGESLVVVANVETVFHIRAFDRHGRMVVDTDSARLTHWSRGLKALRAWVRIEVLRRRLELSWPPAELSPSEPEEVVDAVREIVGWPRPAGLTGPLGMAAGPARRARGEPRDYRRFARLLDRLNGLVNASGFAPHPRLILAGGVVLALGLVGLLIRLLLADVLPPRFERWGLAGVLTMFALLEVGWWNIFHRWRGLDAYHFLWRQGAFAGDRFEQLVDEWIRDSEKLRGAALPAGRRLTFGDIAALMREESRAIGRSPRADGDAAPRYYFPPLFLTATNVTSLELELFNSFEPKYAHIEVAAAVRASAGFPGVFRPKAIHGRPKGGWFVDGGVISNFPAWVFADDFRRSMDGLPYYQDVASRPWANIGLRIGDATAATRAAEVDGDPADADPIGRWDYYGRLFRLMTGLARDELEDKLAGLSQRPLLVRQPLVESHGPRPEEMWHLDKVDARMVQAMYRSGFLAAQGQLRGLSFALPAGDDRVAIERALAATARRAWKALGQASNGRTGFRANVFIPQGQRLVLRYHWNMDHDPDRDVSFRFDSGHTGRCFRRRRILVGNLKAVLDRVDLRDDRVFAFYRTTADDYRAIKRPLTWLASVPIFDPAVLYQLPQPVPDDDEGHSFYCAAEKLHDGAVLGVLNLDAAFRYDGLNLPERPRDQLRDDRVRSILAIMTAASSEIGHILARAFAARPAAVEANSR